MPKRRKGQAEMLEWFPRLILLLVAVVVIATLVIVFTNRTTDSPELGRAAYAYHIYYSHLIMLQDEQTGRVYPGIVDTKKMESVVFDEVFVQSNIGATITMTPIDGCPLQSIKKIHNSNIVDASGFSTSVNGIGASTREQFTFPITITSDATSCAGTLVIDVIRKNLE